MSSLIDSLKDQITPDLLRNLSSTLGESSDGVQKALTGGAATILAGLAGKATEPGFLTQIMSLISSAGLRNAMGAAAGGSSSTVSGVSQAGSTLLTSLFGGGMAGIQGKIAEFSGMRASSAGSVLAAAAPMVLGTLVSKVNTEGLTATGLGSMLTAELPKLRGLLPPGISIPGMPNIVPQVQHAGDAVKAQGMNWMWIAALAIIVLFALFWFMNRGNVNNAVNTASNAVSNGASSLGAFISASLPDGTALNIPVNGIENKLLIFIRDPNAPVSNETWFDFDRLRFDSAAATLQPSSQEQLQNIANILKAYPNVKIRIGGYTDNQGDAAANLKLSQDRADTVMAQLVTMGVDPARMDAKGYGEDHAVADNGTDAGRAQNRRISLRVTAK